MLAVSLQEASQNRHSGPKEGCREKTQRQTSQITALSTRSRETYQGSAIGSYPDEGIGSWQKFLLPGLLLLLLHIRGFLFFSLTQEITIIHLAVQGFSSWTFMGCDNNSLSFRFPPKYARPSLGRALWECPPAVKQDTNQAQYDSPGKEKGYGSDLQ